MGETPEARLHAADDEGDILPAFPDSAAVGNGRPVRAEAGLSAGGVAVAAPPLLRCGEAAEHGVEVPRRDEGGQTGAAEGKKGVLRPPVGLGDHPHPVPPAFKYPGDHGGAEGGVVNVGVSADHEEVDLLPPPDVHVLPADGEKGRSGDGGELHGALFRHFSLPSSRDFTR